MKLLFSQRKGLKPLPTAQKEEWDKVTVIAVWNVISDIIQLAGRIAGTNRDPQRRALNFVHASMRAIALELLVTPGDEYYDVFDPGMYRLSVAERLRMSPYRKFYFDAFHGERFDFIELFVKGDGMPAIVGDVSKRFNAVFEERQVGYRIIGGEITDIDGAEEQAEVEAAARESSHIVNAARLLYDRENPDCKNAVKEAICAVEEVCKQITGKDKATLADCLRVIESKAPMHPALKDALTKLYGYTSDESGVRHAGLSDGEVKHAEAKFMLVACSAFCNYLREKQAQQ